ncbi:MAG: hypothetical protein KJ626_15465 [Verrucomicrobia bacterium]|nr:hypothetical protein [Verrucomicrobiota bacterium]
MIIINGGENVGLQPGAMFLVRGRPREITDPITGDVIEHVPGSILGKVRVSQVNPTSSYALMIEGSAKRGDVLEPLLPDSSR